MKCTEVAARGGISNSSKGIVVERTAHNPDANDTL